MKVQVGDFVQSKQGMPRGYVSRTGIIPYGKKKLPAVIIDAGGGREETILIDDCIILYRGEDNINEEATLKTVVSQKRRNSMKAAIKNALSDALLDALPKYGPERSNRRNWEAAIDNELVSLQKLFKTYVNNLNKLKGVWASLSALDTLSDTIGLAINAAAPTLINNPYVQAYYMNFLNMIIAESGRIKPLTQAQGGERLQNIVNCLEQAITDAKDTGKDDLIVQFEQLGTAPPKPSFLPESMRRSLRSHTKSLRNNSRSRMSFIKALYIAGMNDSNR